MEELYRINRVAQILACNRKNVYYLIRQGKLKALRMGPRQTRVSKTSLERYIKEGINKYNKEKFDAKKLDNQRNSRQI